MLQPSFESPRRDVRADMNAWIEVLKSKNWANVIKYYFLCTTLQWILCMVVRDICFTSQPRQRTVRE